MFYLKTSSCAFSVLSSDQADEETDHLCVDLQAVCRVNVQTGDLLRRFPINPQQLDDQFCLIARRDPHHPIFHPETHR